MSGISMASGSLMYTLYPVDAIFLKDFPLVVVRYEVDGTRCCRSTFPCLSPLFLFPTESSRIIIMIIIFSTIRGFPVLFSNLFLKKLSPE